VGRDNQGWLEEEIAPEACRRCVSSNTNNHSDVEVIAPAQDFWWGETAEPTLEKKKHN